MNEVLIQGSEDTERLPINIDDELIQNAKRNAIKTTTDTNGEVHISRSYTNFVPVSNDRPLTIAASRIFTFGMMQTKKDDEEFECFIVNKKDLAEALGMQLSNVYALFDEGLDCYVVKELSDAKMKLMDETKYQANIPIFDVCIYDKESGDFAFRFSPLMKPILIGLGTYNPYFALIAKQSIQLRSTDAVELHRMIENQYSYNEYQIGQYGKKVKVEISIDYLRKRTMTTDKYKSTNLFKSTFIKRLVDDINTNTNLFIYSYDSDKKGKKATSIIFEVQRKQEIIQPALEDNELVIDFKDEGLNMIFSEYLEILNIDRYSENDKKRVKALERQLYEYAGQEDGTINIDNAKKIINKSMIGSEKGPWKNIYPLSETEVLTSNVKETESKSQLKQLEEYYLRNL